jgi:hypothetical protein
MALGQPVSKQNKTWSKGDVCIVTRHEKDKGNICIVTRQDRETTKKDKHESIK